MSLSAAEFKIGKQGRGKGDQKLAHDYIRSRCPLYSIPLILFMEWPGRRAFARVIITSTAWIAADLLHPCSGLTKRDEELRRTIQPGKRGTTSAGFLDP